MRRGPSRRRGRPARTLSLSCRTGPQIEHCSVVRRGAVFPLDLAPPFRVLSLSARVVWCAVIGRKHQPQGESYIVACSGHKFAPLSAPQFAALADAPYRLASTSRSSLTDPMHTVPGM